ncbi:MAG: DUF58 domain-containing protein [Lachnospiraceae bacterium]|nr:DUF58 domain-containing protein [Lachnospiraceae bacterium]
MVLTWIIYLTVMGMLSVCATIFSERAFAVLIVFGLMIPFVSLFSVLFMRKRFFASIHSETENCNAGDEFRFHVKLANRSLLPGIGVDVRVVNEDLILAHRRKLRTKTQVGARSTKNCSMSLRVTHCGPLKLVLKSVRVRSIFGFFFFRAVCDKASSVFMVFPEEVSVTSTPIRYNPYAYIATEEYSTTRPGDDPSEMFGVREYRPGDRINRIHWSLTASRDELIVKEFSLPIDTSAIMLLDVYTLPEKNGAELYDALIASAFGVAKCILRQKQIFYFAWATGKDAVWRLRIEHEEDLRVAMTKVFEVMPMEKTSSVVHSYASRFSDERYRNIIYVTNEITEAAEEGIEQMKYDANVTIYHVVAENPYGVVTRPDGALVKSVCVGRLSDLNAE